jgi:hypothetical protein
VVSHKFISTLIDKKRRDTLLDLIKTEICFTKSLRENLAAVELSFAHSNTCTFYYKTQH